MREHLAQGEGEAPCPGPAGQAEGGDAVAAELEEVVVGGGGGAEGLGEQRREGQLGGPVRTLGALRTVRGLGYVEPRAVHLAARGERQPVHRHEGAGHHVARQDPAQLRCQHLRFGRRAAIARRRHEGDEPPCSARGGVHHDRGLPHRRLPAEHRLDLAQFDPVSVDLDLSVHPPEELQFAPRRPAHEVARPVHPCTGNTGEGVGHEAVGGHGGAPRVPLGQTGTGHAQFAGRARRQQPQRPVDHVRAVVGHRTADRRDPAVRGRNHPVHGDGHGGLGGSVRVPDLAAVRRPAVDGVPRRGLAARGQEPQRGQCGRVQQRQERRRQVGDGHRLPGEQGLEAVDVDPFGVGGEDQGGTAEQRAEDVQDRHVEGQRGEAEEPLRAPGSVAVARAAQGEVAADEIDRRRVRDDDALRLARTARGVQQVRGGRRRHRYACPGAADCVGHRSRVDHGREVVRQPAEAARPGDDRPQPRVAHDVGDALRRQTGVEGYVAAARLQDAEQRRDHRGRALHAHADRRARFHVRPQLVRDVLGPGVEFPVGDLLAGADDGDLLGRARRLLLEERVQRPVAGRRVGAALGEGGEALLVLGGQEGQ